MKIARCNPSDMPLTPRQTEVLKLIACGMTSRQAAARLGISTKTVETHRANLMRRLQISNVAHLVHYAIDHKILSVLKVGPESEMGSGSDLLKQSNVQTGREPAQLAEAIA